jgi:hypothetical protein
MCDSILVDKIAALLMRAGDGQGSLEGRVSVGKAGRREGAVMRGPTTDDNLQHEYLTLEVNPAVRGVGFRGSLGINSAPPALPGTRLTGQRSPVN